MNEDDALRIDCETCAAGASTACNDCVVGHVLANDGGPVPLVVDRRPDPVAQAIDLFARAGLLDDPPVLVSPDELADGLPESVRGHPAGRGPRAGR